MKTNEATAKINWALIAHLPADGSIYEGGPDYGAFRVCHIPATRLHVASLVAETGTGFYRRRMVPAGKNKPQKWAAQEQISGWPVHRTAGVAA